MSRPLVAFILLLQTCSWAAAPQKAPAANPPDASEGIVLSIMATTQGNFGKLGIGVMDIDSGPYLDEKRVWRESLYAKLEITVEEDPSQFRQTKVREGQSLEVAGYRIFVEKINPGARGSIVLRLWSPPEPAKPAKRWPFSWFGR